MRKIFLLIGILWLSFGCSADEPTETVEDNNNTPIDNIVSTNENTEVITEFTTHELNQVEYQVENTWIEENSTMNMKYYYHDHGMLMVSYEEVESTGFLSDELIRDTFIDGFVSGLDDLFNIIETKITIDNSNAYRYDMQAMLQGHLIDLSLVSFDYKNGVMNFAMQTFTEDEVDYNTDFEKVLESIKFPEQTIVEDEIEITEYYFDGIDLVAEDFTITVTDHKVLHPGETGNKYGSEPVLAFWFDITVYDHVTNNEYNPNTAWLFSFEAIQNNNPNAINTIRIGSLPDSAHRESQRQTIKPGGTVSSSISYKLSDLETPVTLIAYDSRILGEELGQFDYPVK